MNVSGYTEMLESARCMQEPEDMEDDCKGWCLGWT